MVKALKREATGKDEKKPGKSPRMKETLKEGLIKCGKALGTGTAAVALVGMLAGCGDATVNDGETPGIPDGGQDGNNTADGHSIVIHGPDHSNIEAVVPGDGPTFIVVDDVKCEGVHNDSVTETVFFRDTPLTVGGYSITYKGPIKNGVLIDIACESTGENVVTESELKLGEDTVIEVLDDGKKITVHVQSRCTGYFYGNMTVEDL